MKRRGLIIAFALLLTGVLGLAFETRTGTSSESPAIDWSRTYGGTNDDLGQCVIQTSDGGYALTGWTESFGAGKQDFWLVKVDARGYEEWDRTYGGLDEDYARSLVQTSDGGFAIIGETKSHGVGSWDFWLIKTDADGSVEWNRTYGGTGEEHAFSLVQTRDSEYVLTGYTNSFGAGSWDFWLIKTDSFGIMQWNKTYGGSSEDEAHCVIETNDGGYLIAGDTRSFSAGLTDAWLIKTYDNGAVQWDKTYGGTYYEHAHSVKQTSDGGYIVAGAWHSGLPTYDLWLFKVDLSGCVEWDRKHGGIAQDGAYSVSIAQTNDGGYIVAGDTHSYGAGYIDVWVVKTDVYGTMLWNMNYGGSGNDQGHSVTMTNDGGFAVAGFAQYLGEGGYDFWLIKFRPTRISASVDIDPDVLNLRSNGEWISAYIELPEGFDVENIDVSSLLMNGTVSAEALPTCVGDHDSDGATDLMVKFERAAVIDYIRANVAFRNTLMTITLGVTGNLSDGTPFKGTDAIKIVVPKSEILPD